MPQPIVVNGRTTYAAGVRVTSVIDNQDGVALDLGVIKVIADLDFLEAAVPTDLLTSQGSVARLEPTSSTAKSIAHVLFNVNRRDNTRIGRGPSGVYLVSPTPTTQAEWTLNDASGDPVAVIRSLAWGPKGNQARIALTNNALDATKRDLAVTRKGRSPESFTALGSGNVAGVYYDGDEYDGGSDTLTFAADRINGLVVAFSKVLIPAVFVPDDMCFDGDLTLTPTETMGVGETTTVVVTGIDRATGAPATATVEWVEGEGAGDPKTTGVEWADVYEIDFSSDDVAQQMTVAGRAFDLAPDDYPKVSEALDRINEFASRGFHATYLEADATIVPLDEIDKTSAATLKTGTSATKYVRADLWAFLRSVNASTLIEAERVTTTSDDGNGLPVALPSPVFLAGGSRTTPGASDWQAAWDAAKTLPGSVVQPLTTSAAVWALVPAHLAELREIGNGAQAWPCVSTSYAAAKAAAVGFNNELLGSVIAIEGQMPNEDGESTWYGAEWVALAVAGMHAAQAPIARFTNRRLPFDSVRGLGGWLPSADYETAIRDGVFAAFQKPGIGWVIQIGSTSYVTRDASYPFRSSPSSVQSMIVTEQFVNGYLDELLGDLNNTVPVGTQRVLTRATFLVYVVNAYRAAVKRGYCRSFDESNIDVSDGGSVWEAVVPTAPLESADYINAKNVWRRSAT